MKNKAVVISAGAIGVIATAWLGAGVVVGQRAEAALQELKNAPKAQGGGLHITRLTHERGLFGAKGQAEIAFEPGCSAEPGADKAITVRVDYTMSHLILPGRLTRFEWQATPLGESADDFKQVFGSVTQLSGSGEVGMGGAVRTDMGLPEISVQRSGEAVQVSASKGFLTVKGDAIAFAWKVDRVVTRSGGMAMEAKDIAVDVDLKNRHLGTGTARVAAEHISLGVGTLEGVSLRSEATEHGDRLDVAVTPSIRRVKANGVDLSDLSLEMAMKGLDTRSVETLSRVFEASCGMKSLTAEEGRKARDAAITLLARGLSVGIPKLAGKGTDGGIDGQLVVELAPSKDGKPSLAAQLKSSGRLDISGTIIPADRRDMAVAMGFAVAQGTGLRAAYEYADGLLKVNERSHDAGSLLAGLKTADGQLHTIVAGWAEPQALLAKAPAQAPEAPAAVAPPAEAPPVEAPAPAPVAAPVPAPAPAPVAAVAPAPGSATECGALAPCVQQTLAAARTQDIEAVRRTAASIDALPKPSPGNRPVSRQLNTVALEALKRDAFAEAVAGLREALKENPRDVEIAGNLGFALVKAGQAAEAVDVLQSALVLDPRRTSTWTPLAEAYALAGRGDDAKAAMWVSFQWSANREKSLAYYRDRVANETREPLRALYGHMTGVAQQQIASLH